MRIGGNKRKIELFSAANLGLLGVIKGVYVHIVVRRLNLCVQLPTTSIVTITRCYCSITEFPIDARASILRSVVMHVRGGV